MYSNLLKLVEGKDYFVITTNVDHQFQKAGFDKKRLFFTQGDYGLFQSVNRKIKKTYDNENWVMKAMDAQGFVKDENGVYQPPENGELRMRIPTELIPKCPDDNSDMTLNLRSDDSFVEDEGWHRASAAYSDFLRRHEDLREVERQEAGGASRHGYGNGQDEDGHIACRCAGAAELDHECLVPRRPHFACETGA